MVKGWDKGEDFDKIRNILIERLKELKDKEGVMNAKRLAKVVIYSIQLRNGSRISEALEAFYKFINGEFEEKDGKKVVKVRVRKKRDEDWRYITWPEWIPWYITNKLRKYNIRISVQSLKSSCKRYTGVNTHTLRYAFITYLARKGVNPSIIAKMTHHSKLEYILRYTQQKIADELLLNPP